MPLSRGHGRAPRFFSNEAFNAVFSEFNSTLSTLGEGVGVGLITGVTVVLVGLVFTSVDALLAALAFAILSASSFNLFFSAAAFAMASFLASSCAARIAAAIAVFTFCICFCLATICLFSCFPCFFNSAITLSFSFRCISSNAISLL